jgi:hypothetical protein
MRHRWGPSYNPKYHQCSECGQVTGPCVFAVEKNSECPGRPGGKRKPGRPSREEAQIPKLLTSHPVFGPYEEET